MRIITAYVGVDPHRTDSGLLAQLADVIGGDAESVPGGTTARTSSPPPLAHGFAGQIEDGVDCVHVGPGFRRPRLDDPPEGDVLGLVRGGTFGIGSSTSRAASEA
ncbi:MAG TPA: hypothetical protein VF148_11365 [Acidimicrobiia bacterium]